MGMTLDEKLTELESRYTLATTNAAIDPTVPVRTLVTALTRGLANGHVEALYLRDAYGKRGGLVLIMTDSGPILWRCLGPIEDALNALHRPHPSSRF